MAVYRYDTQTRQKKRLSPSQVKQITMRALGLDPNNLEDNKTYRRQYDIIRKKIKNYNTLTGDNVSKLSASEFLYSITQRRNYGEDLTITQQNVLNTISINTNIFSKRLKGYDKNIITKGIESAERIFARFIRNSKEGQEYQNWINEPVQTQYIREDTGEIISEEQAKNIKEKITTRIILRREIVVPAEVFRKLKDLSNTLHARQEAIYKSSKSMYTSARDVGSW